MLVVPERRRVILNLRDPTRVTSVIPTAKEMPYQGRNLTVVPHRLPEHKILKNLGIDVPSPLDTYYHWPIRSGWSPMAHQKETAKLLAHHSRAYCLNDLGTAKTLSALWAFDYLRQESVTKKLLVVAPLATLERTWADEIFWNLSHLRFVVLHGTKEQRRKLLTQDVDVYIINHDGVKVVLDDLVSKDFDVVIIDELSQAARNASTDRWKCYKKLIAKVPTVWGMTGTPVPNAPTDAWAQCRLLTPSTVPQFYGHFRDKVMRQITEFKWVPREDALDTVFTAMQPAIRYKRDEVIDLPPVMYETHHADLTKEQARMFKEMMAELYTQSKGQAITAVNEGVKAMKLVQIACISAGTEVLSDTGWKPIETITDADILWDGESWVSHAGLLPRGVRPVVDCWGVRMTPDHRVLSTNGWMTAEEVLRADASERFDRASVRLPGGPSEGWVNRLEWDALRDVGLSLRLRARSGESQPVLAVEVQNPTEALRVQVRDASDNARKYAARPVAQWRSSVSKLDRHAKTVLGAVRQGLQKLRCAGDSDLQTVARVIRRVHGRYGTAPNRYNVGKGGQRLALRTNELPVGDRQGATEQYEEHCLVGHAEGAEAFGARGAGVRTSRAHRAGSRIEVRMGPRSGADDADYASGDTGGHTARGDDVIPSSEGVWDQPHDVEVPDPKGSAGDRGRPYTCEVFDIAHCGPRNRFVVRGHDGRPLIVHNCGVSIADEGIIEAPPKHRLLVLRDIIESAASKVIVFVPFRAPLELITEVLRKGYTVEQIHGGVPKGERDRIFSDFQKRDDPRVLVAQPAAMSHGLTLTAASVIVWFAPVTSAETYEQANGRITRPGQKHSQFIIHLQGTDVEARMYARLKDKTTMQGVLLDMFSANRLTG